MATRSLSMEVVNTFGNTLFNKDVNILLKKVVTMNPKVASTPAEEEGKAEAGEMSPAPPTGAGQIFNCFTNINCANLKIWQNKPHVLPNISEDLL
jgi:hypothetical protein